MSSDFVVHYARIDGFYGSTDPMSFDQAVERANAMRQQADIDDAWISSS